MGGIQGVLGDTGDEGSHCSQLRGPGRPLSPVLVGDAVVDPVLVVDHDLALYLKKTLSSTLNPVLLDAWKPIFDRLVHWDNEDH